MEVLEERVSLIEDTIKRILYIQQETTINIRELSKDIKELKLSLILERQEREKQYQELMRIIEEEHRQWLEKFEKEKQEREEQRKKDWEEWSRKLEEERKQREEERRKDRQEWNKKWGELSNKMGTIVEDIIFPATEPVLTQYFKCDITDINMNHKRKKGNLKDEFDVIAVSQECKTVFLIEVKSTPKIDYINEFKDNKVERFKILFPEYSEYKLVLIFASLRITEDIVNYLTKHRIYAMAYREWEYMDILNFDKIN